jgi:D-glycero-alpha-D-manno-heptose 1-phosphate guanylyltransferase
MESSINTALILAGGLGTRLRPITNIIPKPLVKVGKKPIIAHIIDEFSRNGIQNVYVSVGYKADKIINYLKNYKTSAKLIFIKEEMPLGTGGAVRLALRKIRDKDANIFMTYGDNLFRLDIKKMFSLHAQNNADITLAVKERKRRSIIESSGVVHFVKNRVDYFVEKPKLEEAPSRFINIGEYMIKTKIYRYLPRMSKFSFERDFLQAHARDLKIYAYPTHSRWYPTDNIRRLETARRLWGTGR